LQIHGRAKKEISLKKLSSRILLSAILAICFVVVPSRVVAQDAKPPHWSYEGATDPSHWGSLGSAYAVCSTGHLQSPIDIKGAKKTDLPALKMNYNSVPLNIIDNGHSVQINYPGGSTLTVGDKSYTLKQFHFHHPAEEEIDGKKYDLVAHLVHADSDGHLAVVAVLFKKGAANSLLDTLWKNVPSEKEKATDASSVSVSAKDLLPANLGYYTFQGSLTSPPCSEGVTWYVLKSHETLSGDQLAAFAKLYPHNARPIQPASGREILETK
jgi:carbonic anhydrase